MTTAPPSSRERRESRRAAYSAADMVGAVGLCCAAACTAWSETIRAIRTRTTGMAGSSRGADRKGAVVIHRVIRGQQRPDYVAALRAGRVRTCAQAQPNSVIARKGYA